MPDYAFAFIVRGISAQQAATIGQRITQRLSDDGVTVTTVNTSRVTSRFRVLSVDTATRQVFDEVVEATDRQAASDQVTTATRVVALVREA